MEYFKVSLFLIASFALAIHAGVIATTSDESSSNESNESHDMEELMPAIQRICHNKTGNDEAFNNVVTAVAKAPICVASKIDVEGFARDRSKFSRDRSDSTTRDQFFSTYCPQFNDSLSCMNPIVSEFHTCLDQEEKELLDIVVGVVPEALNFICKNKGQNFFNNNEAFQKCSEKWTANTQHCINKISNATEAMDLSKYGEKQCNEVVEMRSCFQSMMDECSAPRLMELFDIFYRPIVRASPCAKYIQLDANPTSDKDEDKETIINEI